MATTARSRGGFPELTMPPPTTATTSDDRPPQQSVTNGAFPGTLYSTNSNIWNSSYANARDRSLGSHGADDASSGPNGANANPQTNGWSSRPWNTENQPRSDSTSPTRTRDGARGSVSGFFDQPNTTNVGPQNGNGIGNRAFQDQVSAFGQQRLSPQGSTFLEASVNAFPQSRDASAPPSRQSQGSPAFGDLYRAGHTPSSSIHNRQFNNPAFASAQAANQRAFNLNRQQQVEDDLSLGMRRVNLDHGANNSSFNPASQPFQMNPGSQPWVGDGPPSRLSNGSELSREMLAQLAAVRRHSVERASPAPSYRLESNNSPRSYAPTPDPWTGLPSSRDPRTSEAERRLLAQQLPDFAPNFYQPQYPYANIPPQYGAAYAQAFQQNFRQQPLPAHGYPLQAGYLPGVNLAGVHIPGVNLAAMAPSLDHDPARKTRSRLLDEFRQSSRSSKRFELRDIYNHVVEFSGDQHGSRFIQQKLETANSDEKDQIFREIEPNAVQLMKDVFGNYVVQKFFDYGNQAQKRVLAEKMKGKVLDLSVQTYACRVVQKALEHVLVEQQIELVQELATDPFKVIRDSNGNHVVQKMIEVVPREHFEFIMDALRGQVSTMALHAYGCRVVQRMLERGTEQDKTEIMKELDACVNVLISDQYGNYVAQHVIERGSPEDSSRFIELVLSQVLTYSKHKFASNVVEKCFVKGTPAQRSKVRTLLTAGGNDGSSPLLQLARDQYGNYVIQKLLDEFQGDEKAAFEDDIKQGLLITMRQNTLGRQLHALARRVGLDVTASPGSQQASPGRSDAARNNSNSAAGTPVLTNETNTPQSSSPPSTHVSADGVALGEGTKAEIDVVVNAGGPQVQDAEA